jgi:hypothetical protein
MTGGDRLYLSQKNRSCGDLLIGRKNDDAAIGHADINRTIDGAEGECTEGGGRGDGSTRKESFDGAERGATIERETIAVIAGFRGVSDGVSTASQRTVRAAGGECGVGILQALVTFLSGVEGGVTAGLA